MSLERNDEAIKLTVEFPKEKGISLCFGTEFSARAVAKIGGNVIVMMGAQVLATITYIEEFDPGFTLEGYEKRAKNHAQEIIEKIFNVRQKNAALSHAAENSASPVFHGVVKACQ